MNRNILRVLATGAVLAGSLVATPVQATLQGALQRGQTQYLEVTLDPGQYLLYVVTTDTVTKAASEASLSIYETNGKLLKKSALLPPALQIRPRQGVVYDKGTVVEIRRRQTVHFWVQMDVCRMLCGFAIVPVKVEANRLNPIDLPATVLSKKPAYNAAAGDRPQPTGQGSNPTNQPRVDDRQKIYVFQTNSFINTGLAVSPGDRLKVEASGRVRFGFLAGSGGPEGIAFNPEYNAFLHMAHGQLMVRIWRPGMAALDGWVAIGAGGEFVAKSAGVLQFGVNDNQSGDNVGNFQIEVTLNPAQ